MSPAPRPQEALKPLVNKRMARGPFSPGPRAGVRRGSPGEAPSSEWNPRDHKPGQKPLPHPCLFACAHFPCEVGLWGLARPGASTNEGPGLGRPPLLVGLGSRRSPSRRAAPSSPRASPTWKPKRGGQPKAREARWESRSSHLRGPLDALASFAQSVSPRPRPRRLAPSRPRHLPPRSRRRVGK